MRKYAVQLCGLLLEYNPFAAELSLEGWRAKLKAVSELIDGPPAEAAAEAAAEEPAAEVEEKKETETETETAAELQDRGLAAFGEKDFQVSHRR